MNQNQKQNKLLNAVLEYCDNHNLDIQIYNGYAEPGYEENVPVFLANWNEPRLSKISDMLEKKNIVGIEWSDEWESCPDCGKVFRISPSSYDWEPNYINIGYELICKDCAMNDLENALEGYINNPTNAIHSQFIEAVKEIGFKCPLEECPHYETGFHAHQTDKPEDALKSLYEDFGGKEFFERRFDFLFAITGTGQFDVHWTLLIREKPDYDPEEYED